jgi:hypothetical protein
VKKKHLRNLLLAADEHPLGALQDIWRLQDEFSDDDYQEERLHSVLSQRVPAYRQLLAAIRAYETFARSLQDAFDIFKAEAASDTPGYLISDIAADLEFKQCVQGIHLKYVAAYNAINEISQGGIALQSLLVDRFGAFSEPMDAGACAQALCVLHERVQRAKSVEGKRPWFDRIGIDRIYVRHQYRESRRAVQPDQYLHDYRAFPIRRFYKDLI